MNHSPAVPHSSRRKRLWELEPHAHCPVLGVCLPIEALRKIVGKALGGQAVATDYELHCGAVADSRFRSPVAEAIQRELDGRYAQALRQTAKLKTTEALGGWWDAMLREQQVPGPLWAVFTHARCTEELALRIGGEVHMLQHQVGVATRVDKARLAALVDENALLARELGRNQQRSQRMAEDHTRITESLQATLLQLRGQLLVKDSMLQSKLEHLRELELVSPGLGARAELAREVERLTGLRQELQRSLFQARQEADRLRAENAELKEELARSEVDAAPASGASAASRVPSEPRLNEQAVLCVGGRPASVPIYRQVIEGTGGRFLHHDGGEEDSAAKLDDTLAAADLVICQTGCISHDAYWRVKDHCKRTGKKCVYVESPSESSLRRALVGL